MNNRNSDEIEILALALKIVRELSKEASQASGERQSLPGFESFFPNGVTKDLSEAINQLTGKLPADQDRQKLLLKLLDKFYRRTDEAYAKERFDLARLDSLLDQEGALNAFFQPTTPHSDDEDFRQKINMVTKVIDHFELVGLMEELLNQYPNDVYAIERKAYLKPEQTLEGERYNKFYTDLRVVKNDDLPQQKRKHISFDEKGNKIITRLVIKPKKQLQPRLSYSKLSTQTPKEKKHGLTKRQTLKNISLKSVTTLGITILGTANANKVPGRGFLGPIRRVNNIQELKENKVTKVISIEETLVSERRRLFGKKKASAHTYDLTSAGISVIKVETPDLTPMSKAHTEMVARAIFETVKQLSSEENFFIHCKAGMSRSATALLAFYAMHASELRELASNEKDKQFFGNIEKLLQDPTKNAEDLVQVFRNQPDTRKLKLLDGQKQVLNDIMNEKRGLNKQNENKNTDIISPLSAIKENLDGFKNEVSIIKRAFWSTLDILGIPVLSQKKVAFAEKYSEEVGVLLKKAEDKIANTEELNSSTKSFLEKFHIDRQEIYKNDNFNKPCQFRECIGRISEPLHKLSEQVAAWEKAKPAMMENPQPSPEPEQPVRIGLRR